MKRKRILTAGIIAAFGLAILTSSAIYAQDEPGKMSTIVHKIAQKFNLNESDVQAVFDAERAERKTQMKAKLEARLSKLVLEGKITATQKQMILTKVEEEGTTKANLKTWAKENGINLGYLMPFVKGHGHFKMLK